MFCVIKKDEAFQKHFFEKLLDELKKLIKDEPISDQESSRILLPTDAS